jgi:hypothetical protein
MEIYKGHEEQVREMCFSSRFSENFQVYPTSGQTSILVASQDKNFPLDELVSKNLEILIETPGQPSQTLQKRRILRTLVRESKAVSDQLEGLISYMEGPLGPQETGRVRPLLSIAKQQQTLEEEWENKRIAPDHQTIVQFYLQAIGILENQGIEFEYLNSRNLGNLEYAHGSIVNLATIMILMDSLQRRIKTLENMWQFISHADRLKLRLNDALKTVKDFLELGNLFLTGRPSINGQRLSHSVLSNWNQIKYGLTHYIGELEDWQDLLKRVNPDPNI